LSRVLMGVEMSSSMLILLRLKCMVCGGVSLCSLVSFSLGVRFWVVELMMWVRII